MCVCCSCYCPMSIYCANKSFIVQNHWNALRLTVFFSMFIYYFLLLKYTAIPLAWVDISSVSLQCTCHVSISSSISAQCTTTTLHVIQTPREFLSLWCPNESLSHSNILCVTDPNVSFKWLKVFHQFVALIMRAIA